MGGMPKRPQRANSLALAVLALLFERPMHPYEMAATMKERGKHDSIKLRYGSLYTVIAALLAAGLIAVKATERDSGRPERTVYAITKAGEAELREWMRDLLSRPVKEYPQFEAGLSLLPVLPPDEAVAMLKQRLREIDDALAARRAVARDAVERQRVHPLFMIEDDYRLAVEETERRFVAALIERIEKDDWKAREVWQGLHDLRARTGTIGEVPR
jgi:DNA-binding PadR family transcriptional regulator